MTDHALAPPRHADRRGIISWMMFDWATQPFHTLIITFVFAPYFAAHIMETPERGQEVWGLTVGLGGVIIALMAPVLGAVADSTGRRKPWIAAFSVLGVAGCWMLWFAVPDGSNLTLILVAVVIGLLGMEFAAVFNNAMMPSLVPRARLGRLSGSAWALGYVGGIVSLILVLGFLAAQPASGKTLLGLQPLFGLDPATFEGDRASGPLSAVWYLVFVMPMFLYTPDVQSRRFSGESVRRGLQHLGKTLRGLPGRKSFFSFLIASMFYRDALNTLYTFGGIYAAGVLKWTTIQIGTFGVLAATVGVLGAWAGGQVDDRRGSKLVVNISIVVLLLCCLLVLSIAPGEILFLPVGSDSVLPDYGFYLAGCLIGAFGGALQAASRTLLVDQVPADEVTEGFGLYALSGKATTFVGPFLIAGATWIFNDQRLGVTPVIILFLLGLVLLPRVRGALDPK